jgi:predicted NBD/HSP70 family sugar kinase
MIEIAIDVGGTFTDVVCLHDQQRLWLVKVPTTPDDLVQGVRQGVARVLELAAQPTTAMERFFISAISCPWEPSLTVRQSSSSRIQLWWSTLALPVG